MIELNGQAAAGSVLSWVVFVVVQIEHTCHFFLVTVSYNKIKTKLRLLRLRLLVVVVVVVVVVVAIVVLFLQLSILVELGSIELAVRYSASSTF